VLTSNQGKTNLTEYSWKFIFQIALKHKKQLIKAHLIAILAALMSVPIPLLMPLLVDEVLLQHPSHIIQTLNQIIPVHWQLPIGYISCILGVSFLLRLLAMGLNTWQSHHFSHIAKEISFKIRKNLIRRLQFISMSEYENLGTGAIITNLVTDLDTLDQFIGSTVSKLLVSVLTVTGTAIILLWMHWQLGLFIVCFNPIVIYFTRAVGSQVKNLKLQENTAYSMFQNALAETLEAIHQIRASNREQYYCSKLINSAENVKNHAITFAWKSEAASRLSFLIFLFGFDLFRAIAMLMVIYSDLSLGEMLAVSGYLWYMMTPVQEILNIQYALYAAKAALIRINKLNKLEQEPVYPHLHNPFLEATTVGIRIENLHFSYGEQEILTGINLKINAAEQVALVGASGGGKSTLAQTLIGLYPINSGMIYFNEIPLTEIGLEVVREHVATVLQHPILFNDTIRANLTLGRIISDNKLLQALNISQLETTINSLPQGLDTMVGRQGMKLSGGQRQRLAIARMIVSDPKVVILDEATSALDAATEYKLHQAMRSFLQQRTTIIIAHRLSAVKQANHVYVFEAGKICEQGNHATLIQQNGLYSKLYGEYQ